jgi:hypothetical protein
VTTTEPTAVLLHSLAYLLAEPRQFEHGHGGHPNVRRSTAQVGSGPRAGGGTQPQQAFDWTQWYLPPEVS